jgi:hypothetical protein
MIVAQIQTPLPDPPGIPVDPNMIVHQIVPLIGGLATLVVIALVARWLFRSPIGEAIAEGIRQRRQRRFGFRGPPSWRSGAGDEGADEHRLQALEEQIRLLTAQVSELGERLDFTERVLVEHRERRIGSGK